MRTFDVIVAGLGAMGAAACHHLAQRGVAVLGLDRFGVPNDRGSSHGQTRVIRRCYYEHPDYVPLLDRAYAQWRALEDETSRRLLFVTGGLYTGRPDRAFISGNLAVAAAHGIAHERLDRAALGRRFDQFHVPEDHVAVYEPEAGYVLAEAAVSACAESALRRGAELRGHEPLMQWRVKGTGVEVTTSSGRYAGGRLVVCGGPWAAGMLADLNVPLTVTRQPLAWVWPRRPSRFETPGFPVFGVDDPEGFVYYGFPMGAGRPGFKVARHFTGPIVEPDAVDREVTAPDVADLRAFLATRLPDADGPLLSAAICLYTNTPDGHFIIDHHPGAESVILAAGFSGHGFKFASVIGEVLADLALDGRSGQPVQFLRLARLGVGR